jgi:hypothetical protein
MIFLMLYIVTKELETWGQINEEKIAVQKHFHNPVSGQYLAGL